MPRVMGGWAFSYGRGTPVLPDLDMASHGAHIFVGKFSSGMSLLVVELESHQLMEGA